MYIKCNIYINDKCVVYSYIYNNTKYKFNNKFNNNKTIVVKVKILTTIIYLTTILVYMQNYTYPKVAFLKFENFPAIFAPCGLLDELLKTFSYHGLGQPMDLIPRDPSCCSFHTPGSFIPPWCPALKMTAPLLSGKLADDEWKKNLRMTRDDFLDDFRDDFLFIIESFFRERSDAVRKDTLSLGKRAGLTLYYLKDQGAYSMTCNAFGCSNATISLCVNEVCNIITNYLGPMFIKYPVTQGEVQSAIDGFLQKSGFPQVIGCIDGTHIPIRQPSVNAHDYFSYKMKHTINCQAICNHN